MHKCGFFTGKCVLLHPVRTYSMRNRYLVLLLTALFLVVTAVAADKKFTLVIDAGHGGHDAGAVGAITKEKIINLNVALAFGRLVERNCSDVRVIYTRKTDVFVPLHTRADIANRAKADLFISIHTNSLPKGRVARGLETYTLGMHRAADNLDVAKRENSVILIEKDYKQRYQGFDPNSSESYIMCEFIQDRNMAQSLELAKAVQRRACASSGRQNKGVKQAGFLVLRETSMPSCLIELGFISTPDEERYLNSDAGVQQLARGIYEAFLDYRKGGGQPAKRKKSAIAQELADAREGRLGTVAEEPSPAVDADSVISAEPDPEVVPLEETPAPQPAPQPAPEAKPKQQPAPEAKPKQQPAPEAKPKQQPAPEAKPKQQPAPEAKPKQQPATPPAPAVTEPKPAQASGAPVFKVQILASATRLKNGDALLKGQKNVDCYQDNGMYKYTVGASENYNEIYQLRKTLVARFPQAFIIAFKDGKRTDVQQAVQEFKKSRRSR